MRLRVVQPAKHYILERQATLMAEIVTAQHLHNVRYRHGALGRHQHGALLVYGRMQTDCQMAVALFDETFQLAPQPDTAHSYALGTPGVTVISRQHFRSPQHIVKIVHRFALTHEHDVGQRVTLRQRIYLVKDVAHREVAFKTLLARLAKQAVHLASHLRRHAQRGTVFVWNVNRLDKLSRSRRIQVFHRAVT